MRKQGLNPERLVIEQIPGRSVMRRATINDHDEPAGPRRLHLSQVGFDPLRRDVLLMHCEADADAGIRSRQVQACDDAQFVAAVATVRHGCLARRDSCSPHQGLQHQTGVIKEYAGVVACSRGCLVAASPDDDRQRRPGRRAHRRSAQASDSFSLSPAGCAKSRGDGTGQRMLQRSTGLFSPASTKASDIRVCQALAAASVPTAAAACRSASIARGDAVWPPSPQRGRPRRSDAIRSPRPVTYPLHAPRVRLYALIHQRHHPPPATFTFPCGSPRYHGSVFRVTNTFFGIPGDVI